MKDKNLLIGLLCLCGTFLFSGMAQAQNSRKIIDFNSNWLFEQDDWIGLNNASQYAWDDSGWVPVQTPHCFNADDTFDQEKGYYRGYAWYRKHFRVPASEKGQIIKINFGAIGNESEIWVNEKYCGKSYLGYVPVEVDITDKIKWDEENLIAVRVQNTHQEEVPPGRWRMDYNVYGGIYREVSMISLSPVHLVNDELIVTTPVVSEKESNVQVSACVINKNTTNEPVEVMCTIKDGKQIVGSFSQKAIIPSGLSLPCNMLSTTISNPRLWSIDNPHLYTLEASLLQNGKQIDHLSVKFGVRSARFDADNGFFLNGKPLKLKGLNRHQCYPGLGNAVPVRLQVEDAIIMKELGANYIRCSHYPQHESFLNACDSLGLLVYEEIASWQHIGGDEFIDHVDEMMQAMIRRDRNHPSVFLWGMMNEGRSAKMFEKLGKNAKLLDPTRPTCYAENHIDVGIKEGTIFMPGVSGLNYSLEEYDQLHRDYPQLKLINTECTNGDKSYIGDLESQLEAANKIIADLDFMESRPWIAGSCIWCFHDYGSEYKPVRPIQTSGIVDVYRNYKEAAWMLRARWTEGPIVHISGNWDYLGEEGEPKDVYVWNNCNKVELYLNGKKLEKSSDNLWKVPYQPGELKAVGTKGKNKTEYVLKTAGKAAKLICSAKFNSLKADGFDAFPVKAQLVDSEGNPLTVNDTVISFEVTGPGKLVGIGVQTAVKSRAGMADILIQSTGKPGIITVSAKSDGVKTGELQINAN